MNFTVMLCDVPVGNADVVIDEDGEFGAGMITLLPGNLEFVSIVRAAELATSNMGYMPPDGAITGGVNAEGSAAGEAAYARLAQLEHDLSFIDHSGRALPRASFNLLGAHSNACVSVMITLGDPDDPVGAVRKLPHLSDSGHDSHA